MVDKVRKWETVREWRAAGADRLLGWEHQGRRAAR